MKLCIDLDGVIFNQLDLPLKIAKEQYGIEMDYDDVTVYNPKIGPTDLAEIIIGLKDHYDYIRHMPVYEHAVDVMNSLYKDHYIMIITARPESQKKATIENLNANGIPFHEFICANNKSDYDFDVMVDDYPKHIRSVLEKPWKKRAIMFTQPWNMADMNNETNPRLFRAFNWMHVHDTISDLKEQIV